MMHAEFQILYPIWLAVNNEHLFGAVESGLILFDNVAQSENVGNCLLTIPHLLLVSFDLCLLTHGHGAAVALQAHALVGFEYVSHQCFVADQIYRGLAVQQDDLS
jgi:hypothetical protein